MSPPLYEYSSRKTKGLTEKNKKIWAKPHVPPHFVTGTQQILKREFYSSHVQFLGRRQYTPARCHYRGTYKCSLRSWASYTLSVRPSGWSKNRKVLNVEKVLESTFDELTTPTLKETKECQMRKRQSSETSIISKSEASPSNMTKTPGPNCWKHR